MRVGTEPTPVGAERRAILRLEGVSKAYPGVVANDRIDLTLNAGEVHALVGENGAGKSTLIGILYGLLRPDEGRLVVDERPVSVPSPRHARELGIGLVQQHFSLIPTLTPAENLVLALRGTGRARSPAQARAILDSLGSRYGFFVEADTPVEELPIAQQQRTEVLKALAADIRVLALDEPNALLTPAEWEQLSAVLRRLADSGMAVLLISHKLEDVMRLADRVSVLRRGRLVGTQRTAETDVGALGVLMVGEVTGRAVSTGTPDRGGPSLRVRELCVDREDRRLIDSVSLELCRGEIVGLAGVEGSGQVELTEALAGVRTSTSGQVHHEDVDVTGASVARLQRRGFGHVPADRHASGLINSLTVAENLLLPALGTGSYSRWGLLSRRAVGARARALVEEFDIRVPGPDVMAGQLSGGNQQKVVLARELARRPNVLVCCYATRGLDFAATDAVRRRVREARDAGAAVLYASVDLDELMELADRIVVMHAGRVAGELLRADATAERLGALMGGSAAA